MFQRILGSAAAMLSAAVAVASDPLPLPQVALPPDHPPVIYKETTTPNATVPRVTPPSSAAASRPTWTPSMPGAKPSPLPPPRVSMMEYTQAPAPPSALPLLKPPAAVPTMPPDPPPSAAVPNSAPAATGTALDDLCCDPEVRVNNYWIRAGYSMTWIKPAPLPGIVATGPGTGTQFVIGNSNVNYGTFDGVLVEGGLWLNHRQTIGLELSGFVTGTNTVSTSIASSAAGAPNLVRPFFNPQLAAIGGQDAIIVSTPDLFAGQLTVDSSAQLSGAQANILVNLARTECRSVNLKAGFRYFDLEESLTITQHTRALGPDLIPFFGATNLVSSAIITDQFQTRNQFYGGQVGLEAERRIGPFWVGAGVDVGFGPVHQVTEVNGTTIGPTGAGGPGGMLAVGLTQPGNTMQGNLGRTTTNRFAALCDAHIMAGVSIGDRVRAGIGYNYLYLTGVARPGRQISNAIDQRLIPVSNAYNTLLPNGATVPPITTLDRDDFYAHGVRFIVELDY